LGGRLEVKTLNEFFKLQAGVKDDGIDSDFGFSEDGDATQPKENKRGKVEFQRL